MELFKTHYLYSKLLFYTYQTSSNLYHFDSRIKNSIPSPVLTTRNPFLLKFSLSDSSNLVKPDSNHFKPVKKSERHEIQHKPLCLIIVWIYSAQDEHVANSVKRASIPSIHLDTNACSVRYRRRRRRMVRCPSRTSSRDVSESSTNSGIPFFSPGSRFCASSFSFLPERPRETLARRNVRFGNTSKARIFAAITRYTTSSPRASCLSYAD